MADASPISPELVLIRHAPVGDPGRLFGRTDVAARIDPARIARLRDSLPEMAAVVTSPALRCRQTTEALWPGRSFDEDSRLWEQDFGDHEGLAFGDLPDLGPMDGPELSRWAPPRGESFAAMVSRIAPSLTDHARTAVAAGAPVALVVHAGVIRAAVSQVTGTDHAGLALEVGNLSVTRLRCGIDGPFSIIEANRT